MSSNIDREMERYEELMDEFTDSEDSEHVTVVVDSETDEKAVISGDVTIVSSPPPGAYVRVLICQNCSPDELAIQYVSPAGHTYEERIPDENTFQNVFEIAGEMACENACPLLNTVQRESVV